MKSLLYFALAFLVMCISLVVLKEFKVLNREALEDAFVVISCVFVLILFFIPLRS